MKAPDKLREWLAARGMKHGFFAQRVGCADSTLSGWLAGDRFPSVEHRGIVEALTDGAIKAGEW